MTQTAHISLRWFSEMNTFSFLLPNVGNVKVRKGNGAWEKTKLNYFSVVRLNITKIVKCGSKAIKGETKKVRKKKERTEEKERKI